VPTLSGLDNRLKKIAGEKPGRALLVGQQCRDLAPRLFVARATPAEQGVAFRRVEVAAGIEQLAHSLPALRSHDRWPSASGPRASCA